MSYKFIDLFSGIGGFRLAMESIGGTCVFSSDIDPKTREVYRINFGEEPSGDIQKIPTEDDFFINHFIENFKDIDISISSLQDSLMLKSPNGDYYPVSIV